MKTANAKAKSIMLKCITDQHTEYVRNALTTREMLNARCKTCEKRRSISKLTIRNKLLTVKCTISLQV